MDCIFLENTLLICHNINLMKKQMNIIFKIFCKVCSVVICCGSSAVRQKWPTHLGNHQCHLAKLPWWLICTDHIELASLPHKAGNCIGCEHTGNKREVGIYDGQVLLLCSFSDGWIKTGPKDPKEKSPCHKAQKGRLVLDMEDSPEEAVCLGSTLLTNQASSSLLTNHCKQIWVVHRLLLLILPSQAWLI